MSTADDFLSEAAALAGVSPQALLSRVLHEGDAVFREAIVGMDHGTAKLALDLDRELRLRNPGLQYVIRKMFIGYRREGHTAGRVGERSQIFASIVRSTMRLEVVMPVDPDQFESVANSTDLRGRGHHGVGDFRVVIGSRTDLDQFLNELSGWLMPSG